MRAAFALLGLACASLIVPVALACSYDAPATFEVLGDASDDAPPAVPTASVERIKRGKAAKQEGCSRQSSSCDDIAYVLLDVSAAQESDVGYVLQISGRAPEEFAGYVGRPLTPHDFEPGKLRLLWLDGEGEKNYDFELEIWSVDRAGNMSETSTRLRIDNDGSDGCSAHTGGSNAGWLAARHERLSM